MEAVAVMVNVPVELEENVEVNLPVESVVPEAGLSEPPVVVRLTEAPETGLPPEVTVTVIVDCWEVVILLGLAETWTEREGVGEIVTDMSVERVRLPPVPVTRSVKVPVLADEDTVTVNTLESCPFAGGVTGFLLKEQDTPDGVVPTHEVLSETCELKPLIEVIVMVEVLGVEPEEGRVKESEFGLADRLKSGGGVDVGVALASFDLDPSPTLFTALT
ncbi:MAG: hypothetical protein QW566_01090 [Candidatus Jordarchaeales archaeon]